MENPTHEWAALPIDINAIAPGAVNTQMTGEVLAAGPQLVGEDEFRKRLEQKQKGGRKFNRRMFTRCAGSYRKIAEWTGSSAASKGKKIRTATETLLSVQSAAGKQSAVKASFCGKSIYHRRGLIHRKHLGRPVARSGQESRRLG